MLHIDPYNPHERHLKTTAEVLRNGGLLIFPTDTIYGLGCDIHHPKAIEKIARLKKIRPQDIRLSFICDDLSELSKYTRGIDTPLYRMLKGRLPGPYTFILPSNREVPRLLQNKKQTIGLRIPDNAIARGIARYLGNAILSTSLPGEMVEEYTDPALMLENFGDEVDVIIDGGAGGTLPSTVVDCTIHPYTLIRQGKGSWEEDS